MDAMKEIEEASNKAREQNAFNLEQVAKNIDAKRKQVAKVINENRKYHEEGGKNKGADGFISKFDMLLHSKHKTKHHADEDHSDSMVASSGSWKLSRERSVSKDLATKTSHRDADRHIDDDQLDEVSARPGANAHVPGALKGCPTAP